jgi:hypothetical protein
MALGLAVGSIGNVLAPYAAKGLGLLGRGLGAAIRAVPGGSAILSAGASVLGAIRSGYEWLFPPGWVVYPEGMPQTLGHPGYQGISLNGVAGDLAATQFLANGSGLPVFYNPSHPWGVAFDILESAKQRLLPFLPDPVTESFVQAISQARPGFQIFAHSQGALISANAALYSEAPGGLVLYAQSPAVSTPRLWASTRLAGWGFRSPYTPWGDVANIFGPSLNPFKVVSGVADLNPFCLFCIHSAAGPVPVVR